MTANDDSEEVVLITSDKYLEGIMLEDYPGKIMKEQIFKGISESGNKVYIFSSLDKRILLNFLEKYKDKHHYVVRRSSDGKLIEVNKLDKQLDKRTLEQRFLMAIFNYLLYKEISYISYN